MLVINKQNLFDESQKKQNEKKNQVQNQLCDRFFISLAYLVDRVPLKVVKNLSTKLKSN